MNKLIESRLQGVFRSYKSFRSNGDVVLHTTDDFQEWDFDDNHVLTISHYKQQRKKIICQTSHWTLDFENKRYYINIAQPQMRLEVISINHTGMVIENSSRSEKTFFAPFSTWEDFVKNRQPVM